MVSQANGTDEEVEILRDIAGGDPTALQLSLLWAAKEALKKAVGTRALPGFMDIKLARAARNKDDSLGTCFIFNFTLPDNVSRGTIKTCPVGVLSHKEHVLAFTAVAS